MEFAVERLTEIAVYPCFGSVSLEVSPCLAAVEGRYARGNVEHMAYEGLDLELASASSALTIGATYVAVGLGANGAQVQTHWMYCTQIAPHPTFGISRNQRIPGVFGAAPFVASSCFVVLEPLRHVVGLTSLTPTDLGISEYKLSGTGDLIATAFGVPHAMGIRVEDPFMPPHFLTGARNLTLLAKSARTGQTIGLSGLKCIRAISPAIFIQEDWQ
ncbi:hypothetical protein [Primorskyibacter flagellatus]|uniref:Uncharacterized protein n=1 Tax=Primorskyibacter flagellatus TaxID=1387277 RepID=A0A1W2CDF6_9RHOB|nr:hypothetical protein [Primorskyibacter flagellatus]SMC83181.1 hypothetical protein SAMN06295998_107123 [Primorskyibacter flagellatus]